MDRTLSMMVVDPRLIEIRRNYAEKCRQQWELMRNAFPGAYMQQQAMQSNNSLAGLLGGIGGLGISTDLSDKRPS